MRRLVLSLSILLLLLAGPACAAGLIEEDLALPVSFSGRHGATTLQLEALVVRPDDGKRHPLAVLNHGAPRDAKDRATMHARGQIAKAREFARRGWTTLVVMRRGYGRSEGDYAESSGKCNDPDYVASGRASAEDIRHSIAAMARMPYVDAGTVISVGQSAGGFATVALTADPPPGLVAAISFAGGRGSARPDEVCIAERLEKAFATFGRTSRIPMLWVYAANDHYFTPRLARRFHAAFNQAGGKAQFIAAPEFGDDGHLLFSTKGTALWVPYVENFLAEQRLTQFSRPLPPRDDGAIAYPRVLSEKGRAAFRNYLDAAAHKAFAVASDGAYGWRPGRNDKDEAEKMALALCAEHTRKRCRVIMLDGDAVK